VHRHADYFGTEVVEFEVSRPHRHLTIDVRARVSTKPSPPPPQSTWDALSDPSYREAGGEFLLQTDDALGHPLLQELIAITGAATTPLATVLLISELIPDRFALPTRRHLRRLTDHRSARGRGRRLPGLRPSRPVHPAPSRHRRPLRLGLPVRGRLRRDPRVRRGRHARMVGGPAAALKTPPTREAGAGLGRCRPHQPHPRRRDPRQDRPRPPLRRRAADQGCVPRRGEREARRAGHDDTARALRSGLDRPLLTVRPVGAVNDHDLGTARQPGPGRAPRDAATPRRRDAATP